MSCTKTYFEASDGHKRHGTRDLHGQCFWQVLGQFVARRDKARERRTQLSPESGSMGGSSVQALLEKPASESVHCCLLCPTLTKQCCDPTLALVRATGSQPCRSARPARCVPLSSRWRYADGCDSSCSSGHVGVRAAAAEETWTRWETTLPPAPEVACFRGELSPWSEHGEGYFAKQVLVSYLSSSFETWTLPCSWLKTADAWM